MWIVIDYNKLLTGLPNTWVQFDEVFAQYTQLSSSDLGLTEGAWGHLILNRYIVEVKRPGCNVETLVIVDTNLGNERSLEDGSIEETFFNANEIEVR